MPRRVLASLAPCLCILLSIACSGNSTSAPTASTAPFGGSSHVMASIQPPVVPVVPAPPFVGMAGGCPHNPPFTTSFAIVVNPTSMFVDHVTFHFLDGSNWTSQPIMFGRETIQASSPGRFPFTVPFGCWSGRPDTVIGDVTVVDGFGAMHTVSVSAATK